LRGVPHLEKVRRQVYEDALQRLLGLLARKGNDPATQYKLATAYARVAEARVQLGQFEGGEQAQRRAVDLFTRLATEFPDRPVFREQQVMALYVLGQALAVAAKHREAEQTYRQGLELARRLTAERPDEIVYRLRQASFLSSHAEALRELGRLAEA